MLRILGIYIVIVVLAALLVWLDLIPPEVFCLAVGSVIGSALTRWGVAAQSSCRNI